MQNKSGIRPLDLRVLVKPDKTPNMIGNIHIPDVINEREQMAECRAVLVAAGKAAFSEAKDHGEVPPEPGARVMIAKYAGIVTKGDDGEEYRLCNDGDIVAVLS